MRMRNLIATIFFTIVLFIVASPALANERLPSKAAVNLAAGKWWELNCPSYQLTGVGLINFVEKDGVVSEATFLAKLKAGGWLWFLGDGSSYKNFSIPLKLKPESVCGTIMWIIEGCLAFEERDEKHLNGYYSHSEYCTFQRTPPPFDAPM